MADELATREGDYQALGTALVEEAQKKEQERIQQVVVSGVQAMLQDVTRRKKTIQCEQHEVAKQEKRIAALQRGAFKIDKTSGAVIYDDVSLNGGYL